MKFHTQRYFNRELSWLEFNARVLEEARSPETPLLERLKFLSIFSKNLDEFFMVRVAGLKKLLQEDFTTSDSPDDIPLNRILSGIRERVMELIQLKYQCFHDVILPGLKQEGVEIVALKDLTPEAKKQLANTYHEEISPVLTPLAVDPAHPFPFLTNLSLYLVALFKEVNYENPASLNPPIGLVEVPSVLPRLIPVTSVKDRRLFVLLEDLVAEHMNKLFVGFEVSRSCVIRVSRNLDYNLLENEVVDLLRSVQKEVTNREHQEAIRLQISGKLPKSVLHLLKHELETTDDDLYEQPSPMFLAGLMSLYQLPLAQHKDAPFNPRLPVQMATNEDIFSLIRTSDLLLHHPYDSFYPVIEFVNVAAQDTAVLAIKQTLYRTSGDSPIIDALIKASENGKQVTAVVELKARFDEKNNITWARRLERAGVNVVFGFVGLKTHCKATLVVRKESGKLVRYVHLGTGNYNSSTAKMYTDISFFSAEPVLGNDIANMFNLLTGFNILSGEGRIRGKQVVPDLKKIALSPLSSRSKFLELIQREMDLHKAQGGGRLLFKCNAVNDKEIIEKLYEASNAGVRIDLIVRGVCCLKPQVAGMSENIRVISVVDRFLEHSRIYYFRAGGLDEVFLASADISPRNMDRRIEIFFPIDKKELRHALKEDILESYLRDNCYAWELQADGNYKRHSLLPEQKPWRVQNKFIEVARDHGVQSIPYDQAMKHDATETKGKRPIARKREKRPVHS